MSIQRFRMFLLFIFVITILFNSQNYFQALVFKMSRLFIDDFTHCYIGSLYLREGGSSLYDQEKFVQFGERLGFQNFARGAHSMPLLYLMMVPLTYTDLLTATRIFLIINHLLMFLSIYYLVKSFHASRGEDRIDKVTLCIFCLSSLFYGPFIDTMLQGQLNCIVLIALSLTIYFALKRKVILSGLFLSMGIGVKLFPAIVWLYFLGKKEYKLCLWTLFFYFFLNISVGFFYGFSVITSYIRYFFKPFAGADVMEDQSIVTLLRRWCESPALSSIKNLIPHVDLLVFAVIFLAIMFMTFLVIREREKKGSADMIGEIALLVPVQLLISPRCWSHYHTILLITFVSVFLYFLHKSESKDWISIIFIPLIYLLIASFDGYITRNPIMGSMQYWFLVNRIPLFLMLTLWSVLLAGYYRGWIFLRE